MSGVPLPTVWLPVYKDYSQLAIWPAPQYVSNISVKLLRISQISLERFLLWPTGYRDDCVPCAHWTVGGAALLLWLSVCCTQGHGDPAGNQLLINSIFDSMYTQMPAVKLLDSRPESLIYHDHSFHVMDVKVLLFQLYFIIFLSFSFW